VTGTFRVVESFVRSRRGGDSQSEDMLRDGECWTVVVDGATDKSGIDFDGHTGGYRVAEIVSDVVAAAPTGASASDIVEAINDRYATVLGAALHGVAQVDYPSASFVALDKTTGTVVRVGDTSWRTERRQFRGSKKIDRITGDARAALLRSLLAEGASVGDLRRDDPGREMMLPLLRHQATFRNVDDPANPLTFGAIDGRPVPDRFLETWRLDDNETTVVLTSDGYPQLELRLDDAEAVLAGILVRDPLQILERAGTKAVPDVEGASYDDRAFVRLERT
jgi:hypothetical protein